MARRAALWLCLAAAGACGAAELGTLFHTPEERERLDKLRRGEPVEAASEGPARPPREPVVTGYVRRSDGRHTVFVDGRPVTTRRDPRTLDPKALKPAPEAPASKP